MIELSIIIPCYNESGSLPNLFEICNEALAGKENIEFVFVNNGSKDKSKYVFEELMSNPKYAFIRLVNIPVNRGYGYGILQGLQNARGNCLAWTHADLQTDPTDVIKAYKKYKDELNKGNVLVKGKRKNRNIFDAFFTNSMSIISSVMLSAKVSDVNAQPKMFHKSFFDKLKNPPFDFSLDLYLLYVARKEGVAVIEFPVYFGKRNFGSAKGGGSIKGKIKLIRRTFDFIFKLRKEIKNGER